MGQPFEQQPQESAKAFAAFSLYLSLGPERSIRVVGARLRKSESGFENSGEPPRAGTRPTRFGRKAGRL